MASAIPVGKIIAGRFRIETKLGEGGYGSIYAATQLDLGRRVAMKLLNPDVLVRESAVQRFLREAKLVQGLSHPNIVRLFDHGRMEDGAPFIVYELLNGRSVEQVLASDGPLTAARVAKTSAQVLKALMEAHSYRIVHRDIKPANLFMCSYAGEQDFIKVLDFGIAAAATEDGSSITREGMTVGTPAYMSPEQVLGQAIDGRSDLYALGLVMAEMLVARPVYYGAGGMAVAMQQIAKEPTPLLHEVLMSPLATVIRRATAKDAEQRFGSAGEMLAAVEVVMRDIATGSSGPMMDPRAVGPTQGAFAPTAAVVPVTPEPRPHLMVSSTGPTAQVWVQPPVVTLPQASPRPPTRSGALPWVAASLGLAGLLCAAFAAWIVLVPSSSGKKRAPTATADDETAEVVESRTKTKSEKPKSEKKPMATVATLPASLAKFSVSGVSGKLLLQRMAQEGWEPSMQPGSTPALSTNAGEVFMYLRDGDSASLRLQCTDASKAPNMCVGACRADGPCLVSVTVSLGVDMEKFMQDDGEPSIAEMLRDSQRGVAEGNKLLERLLAKP